MILSLATKIFGSSNERALKKFYRHIEPINALESHYAEMDDDTLRGQTALFRERIEKGEALDDLMHDAFAVVREAAKRTLGQRHFDVQLVGGAVLHHGDIAEMKTGEGKTLVSTLAVYLNALEGKGVHVVTVNDYLAQRDSEWMGQIHRFLGLSVGCITAGISDEERRTAYAADITYGTNNEFGFDYLRDNMKYRLENRVQRPFNYAIVDEVDSILIDEARTPLIISGPSEGSTALYTAVDKLIPKLTEDDYEIDLKLRTVMLTEQGQEHIEDLLRQAKLMETGGMYDIQNIALVHHVSQALRAHKLFHRDTDYIVKDGKAVLIDEFTGRMMEGRRLSEGLHQAIEAKEGVDIQNENQTLASITFQNYFRLYPKLAGMTGTAMTEAAEFKEIYNLGVVEIPTNVNISRIDYNDEIYKSMAEKEGAIIGLIEECRERKQPVLVGTVSIEKSERLAAQLKKKKIPHNVLNARYHEQEALIISQAGRAGAVTIATNMAGRGTDIKMGGDAAMRFATEIDPDWPEDRQRKAMEKIEAEIAEEREIVKEAGGLFVVGTERHESRRIDNQLRGRSGRQGDPGASIFFLSIEDDLMKVFGSNDKLQALLANKQIGLREGEALAHSWISKALERAQNRVEAQNFEIRKNLLKFDNVMNDQRKVIYEQRREIMESEDVSELVIDMRHEVIEDMVARHIPPGSYPEQWDVDLLAGDIQRVLALDLPVADWAKEEGIADTEIIDRLKDVTDRIMAEKAVQAGRKVFRHIEKTLLLQHLDQGWKEHLLNLDHLRQGINLRAFAQRDPLNEYKTEAFAMFEAMLINLRETVTQMLSLVEINLDERQINLLQPGSYSQPRQQNAMKETRQDPAAVTPPQTRQPRKPARKQAIDPNNPDTWGATPRNAPCPCGSGKKYKHCHGKIAGHG